MVDTKPSKDLGAKFKENIDFLDALLADLQAIPTSGTTKLTRDPTDSPPPIPAPPKEALSNGSARNTTSSLGTNLSELDSLLEDLNTATHVKGKPERIVFLPHDSTEYGILCFFATFSFQGQFRIGLALPSSGKFAEKIVLLKIFEENYC